jgi:hypothetical protein
MTLRDFLGSGCITGHGEVSAAQKVTCLHKINSPVDDCPLQNHLFLEEQNRPNSAPHNQTFTAQDSGRFLEGNWSARQAVPTPRPSYCEMTFHEVPEARTVLLGGD